MTEKQIKGHIAFYPDRVDEIPEQPANVKNID